jgi:hypothetical protein
VVCSTSSNYLIHGSNRTFASSEALQPVYLIVAVSSTFPKFTQSSCHVSSQPSRALTDRANIVSSNFTFILPCSAVVITSNCILSALYISCAPSSYCHYRIWLSHFFFILQSSAFPARTIYPSVKDQGQVVDCSKTKHSLDVFAVSSP